MCDPTGGFLTAMAIGAATSGVSAAIQGGDIGSAMLMGGIMGGVTFGIMPPGAFTAGTSQIAGGSGFINMIGSNLGGSTALLGGMAGNITTQAAVGMAATGFAASMATGYASEAMTPEYAIAADYDPIVFNTIENKVTGSGGTQAAASLSSAIKRVKRKSTTPKGAPKAAKQDVSPVNTSNFSDIGLQIA
tara:strand:- start:1271 stop:1840 length:570 start_codon:yes stop_codon:yes gene_type:complete